MGDAVYKKQHFDQGLCVHCNRPARAGKRECEICAQKHGERNAVNNRKYKKIRAEKRLCIRCGRPLIEGELYNCAVCKEKMLRRYYAAYSL